MQASPTTVRATQILMAEHEVISIVLDCIEKLARSSSSTRRLDLQAAKDILDFLGVFADRCHHGKEEACLFPLLVRRGMPQHVGPLAVMLAEHEAGRIEIAEMRAAVLAYEQGDADAIGCFILHARAYVELLRGHIQKENTILFPMADSMVDAGGQAELLVAFENIEAHDMGDGVHERYLALARDLALRLGVTSSVVPTMQGSGCCGHGRQTC